MQFTPVEIPEASGERGAFQNPDIEPGKYTVRIRSIEEKLSRAGSPMLKVGLTFQLPQTIYVDDYVLVSHPKMMWRFRDFVEAIGGNYQDGIAPIEEATGMDVGVEMKAEAQGSRVKSYYRVSQGEPEAVDEF